MRVCIPTETNQGMTAPVAQHFGTAPFFTVFDTESGAFQIDANPSCHSHSGTCHHADFLRARKVDVISCSGMGRGALFGLLQAGMQVAKAMGDTVEQVVQAMSLRQLEPMTAEGACPGHGHGHGNGGCGHHDHHPPHQHRQGHGHGGRDADKEPKQ